MNSYLVSGVGLTLMSRILAPMLVKFPGILMASLKPIVTKPVEVMDLIFTRRSFPAAFVLFWPGRAAGNVALRIWGFAGGGAGSTIMLKT